jgi:selenocysteine lyase/cysteine desulfurase
VFTPNATLALNIALHGLLPPGAHVVTTALEHNAVMRPLRALEQRGVLVSVVLPCGRDGTLDAEAVHAALRPDTRLIVCVHASNVCGTVLPICEIGAAARERGIPLLVDAAQTVGAWPIDLHADHIDLLAFTGHKALLGPVGTGGLYVGPRATLRPWREGGTGGDSANPTQPTEYPHALEAGTPNTVGIAGLGEALRYLARRGIRELADHETKLAARLWERLEGEPWAILYGPRPAPGQPRTGVVSLNVKERGPAEVGAILDTSFGIAVRAGLHCAPGAHHFLGTFPEGTVRASPGPFTTEADIDALAAALREIAG